MKNKENKYKDLANNKLLICSDIHGAYLTMMALLNKYPDRQPVFLGDLIDRGPRSRQVVEYAISHSIPTTFGNHEDICLGYSAHIRRGYKPKCGNYYDRDIWLYNGGEEAFANWQPDMTRWNEGLPKEVLDWMANLPPYIILDGDRGPKTLLSHSGYGLNADTGHWISALWGRYPDDGAFPNDGYLRIFGHTRNHHAQVGNNYINLDTGVSYKGYGVLTGLLWPEIELVTQENID